MLERERSAEDDARRAAFVRRARPREDGATGFGRSAEQDGTGRREMESSSEIVHVDEIGVGDDERRHGVGGRFRCLILSRFVRASVRAPEGMKVTPVCPIFVRASARADDARPLLRGERREAGVRGVKRDGLDAGHDRGGDADGRPVEDLPAAADASGDDAAEQRGSGIGSGSKEEDAEEDAEEARMG